MTGATRAITGVGVAIGAVAVTRAAAAGVAGCRVATIAMAATIASDPMPASANVTALLRFGPVRMFAVESPEALVPDGPSGLGGIPSMFSLVPNGSITVASALAGAGVGMVFEYCAGAFCGGPNGADGDGPRG